MGKFRTGLVVLGCALLGLTAAAQTQPAQQFWQRGQEALRDHDPERAIGFFEESLRLDPTCSQSQLSLALACIEIGDETTACLQLAHYLQTHPNHHLIRTEYAELLLRSGRIDLARVELNHFLLDTEDDEETFAPQHVHCHQRLAEIALVKDDEYNARLHRGIALYIMAQELSQRTQPADGLDLEGLLFKAAAELSASHALDRNKARPCWYLHQTWSKLGQSQQARGFLRQTRDLALFSDLTPGEQRALLLTPVD